MDVDTLDPAHDGNNETGVAGLPRPDPAPEQKPERDDALTVSEDGNIVKAKDGKTYVRQEALREEREARQRLQQQWQQLEPFIPEINEYIQEKQRRVDSARHQAAPAATDENSYLEEVALALGFYNEAHQPDLRRAQAHLNISRREAERAAQKAVEPLARTTQADRAALNRERVRSNKFSDGLPIAEDRYLTTALESLGDQHLADPNVANLAQVVAAGLEALDHRQKGTVPAYFRKGREPMYSEKGSGRFQGDNGDLTDFDLAAARARGKTPEQWAKLSKAINKSSVLEEV